MGGKSSFIKELGPFDVGGQDGLVAPQREIMFGFMDDNKATFLTPSEIIEQCDTGIATLKEIRTTVGIWDHETAYWKILCRIQALIAENNWETRRLRRRAAQAAIDAKIAAMPKFGRPSGMTVDNDPESRGSRPEDSQTEGNNLARIGKR